MSIAENLIIIMSSWPDLVWPPLIVNDRTGTAGGAPAKGGRTYGSDVEEI